MKKVPASMTDAEISQLFVDCGYSVDTIYRFEPESAAELPIIQKRRYRTFSVLLGSQTDAEHVASVGYLTLPSGAAVLIERFNHKKVARAQNLTIASIGELSR